MKKAKIKIYIPKDVKKDVKKALKFNKENFKFNLDYLLFITSRIIHIPMYNKKYKDIKMVPLSSRILRVEIGKNYRKYLDFLLKNNIIVTDNHYIVSNTGKKGKCKYYGLSNKYVENDLIEYVITKKELLFHIIKWRTRKIESEKNDPQLIKLHEMCKKFRLNLKKSKEYLNHEYSMHRITKRQYVIELKKCTHINKQMGKFIFVKRDAFNRVHTNFTNISKNIRKQFLFYNRKKISSVDIVSSQASLLGYAFEKYYEYYKYSVEHPYEVISEPSLEGNENIYNDTINMSFDSFGDVSNEKILERMKNEILKYNEILKQGRLYEFFQYSMNNKFNINKSRTQVKKLWISFVFGPNYNTDTRYIEKIWNCDFPILTLLIAHFKERDYKTLSHELQRLESNIIFKRICPVIDSRLGIDYCTVHDSLMVESKYANDVQTIFNEILQKNNIMTSAKIEN